MITWIIIALALLLSLLQHFVLTLPKTAIIAAPADGIVVTTGGQARLRAGLELLGQGKAPHLLISGVGQGITKQMIASSLTLSPARTSQLDCCVFLDFQAKDTIGNARATKKWADERQIQHIVLVTSDYHMPRAALEMRHHMPQRTITTYPIIAPDLADKSWHSDWQTLRLYLREFLKYTIRRTVLFVSRQAVL